MPCDFIGLMGSTQPMATKPICRCSVLGPLNAPFNDRWPTKLNSSLQRNQHAKLTALLWMLYSYITLQQG